jgi:hypothetical protein
MMDRNDPPLTQVLQEVHAALRAGKLGELTRLTEAMLAAEAHVARASPADLREIRRLAERNAHSLVAARRGIKAARRRITEVLTAARGLVTYDRQGHRVEESESRALTQRF